MKNKILYFCIICIAVIMCVTAGFFIYKNLTTKQSLTHFKCPENYAENNVGTAEYEETMIAWTLDYLKTNPQPTVSDWSMAKTQLWLDNNCVVAIQRSKMSGKVEDLKPYELVDYNIQTELAKTIETTTYTSELGFSFDYPNNMFVMDGSDGTYRLLVIPNSYRDDENQDLTAIVISASLNEPLQTPLEWLSGPYSGADMSNGYSKLDIDGQEAISMNGDNWITFNTPDNKYQISIATLPSSNLSQTLRDGGNNIIDSFTFNK